MWGRHKTISKITGSEAERLACQWLRKQGLELITRNYRCRGGEIDIVMKEQNTLVFVEVRYRKHNYYGSPAETVDWRKQRKLAQAAEHYLQSQQAGRYPQCRFDVIAAQASDSNATLRFYWIKNAIEF